MAQTFLMYDNEAIKTFLGENIRFDFWLCPDHQSGQK